MSRKHRKNNGAVNAPSTIIEDETKRNVEFEQLCRMGTTALFNKLREAIGDWWSDDSTPIGERWIYHEGKLPIILTAHIDTVHQKLPNTVLYSDGKIFSPEGIGGDDRCGVYMILQILKKYDCHVIICDGEETGFRGSNQFVDDIIATDLLDQLGLCKYIIELDRRGKNDAVYYSCDNPKFTKFIESEYWKHATGTGSDISILAPNLGLAAVNLSCGYYQEHTLNEYVVLDEMEKNIIEVEKLIERSLPDEVESFEYIKKKYSYGNYGYCGYYDDEDYWDEGWYSKYAYLPKKDISSELSNYTLSLDVTWKYTVKGTKTAHVTGATKQECLAKLFLNNPACCVTDIESYSWS